MKAMIKRGKQKGQVVTGMLWEEWFELDTESKSVRVTNLLFTDKMIEHILDHGSLLNYKVFHDLSYARVDDDFQVYEYSFKPR